MAKADLETVQKLLEHPLRLAMLARLTAGATLPTRTLADMTGTTPGLLRHHLVRLRDAGVVITEVHGGEHRHRLADADIARIVRPLRQADRPDAGEGLLCDRHLGGPLGAKVWQALKARDYLAQAGGGYALTERGARLFVSLGLSDRQAGETVAACPASRGPSAHLGGDLGEALNTHLLARGWITLDEDGHAVERTARGRTAFANLFGIRG